MMIMNSVSGIGVFESTGNLDISPLVTTIKKYKEVHYAAVYEL